MKKRLFGMCFVLCMVLMLFFSVSVSAQESAELQLYNRNEKVSLSKALLHENDDYYISLEDLEKINVQYNLEEGKNEFLFELYSTDVSGMENILWIDAESEESSVWDDQLGDYISVKSYRFTNTKGTKKDLPVNATDVQETVESIGDFQSVMITGADYYISLRAIALAISHEYHVEENSIRLWITDANHYVLNGEISLPEGDVAPESGTEVCIFIQGSASETKDLYSKTTVFIPQGENKCSYLAETDIVDDYYRVMFVFDGNYKTIYEFVRAKKGSLLNVCTRSAQKNEFYLDIYMPLGLVAEDDVYITVVFDTCAVYESSEPVIKKGERHGRITLDIEETFYGKVALYITGDDRVFPYGYYENNEFRVVPDNADFVLARTGGISVRLLACHKISGQVVPTAINTGYKVRAMGVTDFGEELAFYANARDDFRFEIKVPCSVSAYTLSVAYRPGVYCTYISDRVSSYAGEYYLFNNTSDIEDVFLKYEPYLPDLPVDMKVDAENGYVEIKNTSDDLVMDFTVYCAHYREGKLTHISRVSVDRLMVYSDYTSYRMAYPKEFYKTEEVSFFIWSNGFEPMSVPILKRVNEVEKREKQEFPDVDPLSVYKEAIESAYCSGIMGVYEDDVPTFRPGGHVTRSEAALLFCLFMGYDCHTYDFSCEDVPQTHWASPYVGICVNEHVFELEDNTFRPNECITVLEAYEAMKSLGEAENMSIHPSDLLMNIDSENMEREIKREEFAQLVYNYKVFSEQ